MAWSPKVRAAQVRKLYHLEKRGVDSERVMLDVGWALHAVCDDVVVAVTGLKYGEIPCPSCGDPVLRKGMSPPTSSDRAAIARPRNHYGWFHCGECEKRLLWQDCRNALRRQPRCFKCLARLRDANGLLECGCGQSWDRRKYRDSLVRRVVLPCPNCSAKLRRPDDKYASGVDGRVTRTPQKYKCAKCKGTAQRRPGLLVCCSCGHQVQWRSYKKNLKRRDEELSCPHCNHAFRWQWWRRQALQYSTGNPGAAAEFLRKWPKAKSSDERMMHIDILVQALHGRGALAPVFIEGSEEGVRALLDELAESS